MARKILYPAPEKCALSVQAAAALEHWRQCAGCQSYFEAASEWSRALREKAGTEPAPEPLRERVAAQVASSEKIPAGGRSRRRWIAAAVVLLVAGISAWFASRWPSRLFFQTLCEDHAKFVGARAEFESSDISEVESWFRDKTDFAVRVPALADLELLGGRLCFLRGRKAALVFYRKQGRPVSLFQLHRRDVNLAALDRWEVDGAPIWRASMKGYSLAAFEQRGV
ncbi:MAG: hypothetical protein HY238_22385, partial [Acidobacteria bacterium]|nr:hypothetical protein [Acidobacteriota bacterium]